MKSIKRILKSLPLCQSVRYKAEANKIYKHLLLGYNYRSIGGKKLTISPNLIRFKLGHYRLIFIFSNGAFHPQAFIARKNLESYLKRR